MPAGRIVFGLPRSRFLSGHSLRLALVTLAVFGGATRPVHAADTVETWGRGAKDVDFYLGHERCRSSLERTSFSDAMFGYGVADRFSVYAGFTMERAGAAAFSGSGFYAGAFGTPIDLPHLDVDLFVHAGRTGGGGWEVAPAFELNLDRHPERQSYGLYLRGSLPVAWLPASAGAPAGTDVALDINPGAYLTIARRHQLLVEWCTTLRYGASSGTPAENRVAFGYNVVLSERVELVNEISMALGATGSERRVHAVGFTSGFILTMP